jgi:hypothetical protein
MWGRDLVFWGRPRNHGVLEGRRSGTIIDFRDQIVTVGIIWRIDGSILVVRIAGGK